jgi:hypothetical protein
VPDHRWDERPLAIVALRPGETATATELRQFVAAAAAEWQVPERWAFLPEVPKTSVGKFDKKLLRARYAEGRLDIAEAAGHRRRDLPTCAPGRSPTARTTSAARIPGLAARHFCRPGPA